MARPPKNPAERKKYHLRVPLNEAQHVLIVEAAANQPDGMAEWARTILLDAAKRGIAKHAKAKDG